MPEQATIGVEILGMESLLALLVEVDSPRVRMDMMQSVAKFVRGKLQRYPPQRYVSRKQAYGVTFFSDRQRRWFFAALANGELDIPYQRTNRLSNSWRIMTYRQEDVLILSDVAYGPYVQDPAEQCNMHRLIGWQTTDKIMGESEGPAAQIAQETYNRVMKRMARG